MILCGWYAYKINPTRIQIQRCQIGHTGLSAKCLFQIGQPVVYRLNMALDETCYQPALPCWRSYLVEAGIKNKIQVTPLYVHVLSCYILDKIDILKMQ